MLRREHNREHHLGGAGAGVGGVPVAHGAPPRGGPGEGGFRVPRFKPRTARNDFHKYGK